MVRRLASSFCMDKPVARVAACMLFSALFGTIGLSAKGDQIFRGVIADSRCAALGSHATMLDKGETDARCTATCVKQGAKYVLFDAGNKAVYQLSDQKGTAPFAAFNVIVVGMLDEDTETIHVDDVIGELPPKVKQAKIVAIVCDACPRAMAKATPAAFEQLTVWKRFTVISDPKKADVIFLISANRYLGDYVTRDGPDQRQVHVATTYMNVIDPQTGASYWADSDTRGSWFIAGATKSLVDSFKNQLELDENSAARQAFVERHAMPKIVPDNGK
jgi:hypothetical protein